MKRFTKRGFWVFFAVMALAGAFFIVQFGLQNQSPGIPSVYAQGYSYGSFSGYPGNLGSQMYAAQGMGHPSNVKSTIMTCSGCNQTTATCDWDCGPTSINCSSGGGSSGGNRTGQGSIFGTTNFTCSYSLYGGCGGGGGNTIMTCSGSLFGSCGGGGGNTIMTCSGSLFGGCGGGGGNTFITCSSILGCNKPEPKPTLTNKTCGLFGYGCNGREETYSTCDGWLCNSPTSSTISCYFKLPDFDFTPTPAF